MPVINLKPLDLPADVVAGALRMSRNTDAPAVAAELLKSALPLIQPRALYREAFIEAKASGSVTVAGTEFRSRVLRRNLETAEKVYPFLITVGPEIERFAASQGDMLRQYYLETFADIALGRASEKLAADIARRRGFEHLSSMSPGSLEDWPIQEQAALFKLLGDTESELGVRLSDSLLMIPRKSISGIFFPAEGSFESCRLCPRRNCQGRRAARDPGLRREFGLDEDR